MIQTHFKDKFFSVQSHVTIALMCLIVGIGSISMMLVALQKTNDVVTRCHFCETPFILGAKKVLFLIRGVPFLQHCVNGCRECQVDLPILTKHFCQIFQVTLLGRLIFCNFQNIYLQNMARKLSIRSLSLKIQFSAIFTKKHVLIIKENLQKRFK